MSLMDIFAIIGVSFICYQLIKFLNQYNKQSEVQEIPIPLLLLEKIDNSYYAYLGDKFVGQSNSIDNLILNMRDIHNVTFFNFDQLENLTNEENILIKQSIEKWYTIV
jgi:hypothetical protein